MTAGCTPINPRITYQLGTTHGVVYEAGAARASMNVYRSPRAVLMDVWKANGIGGVESTLWAFGRPPRFSICRFGVCYTTDIVANKVHGWIYGDPWDLKGALFDAQNAHNCLALTIISSEVYNKNWTHKGMPVATSAACQPPGRLPRKPRLAVKRPSLVRLSPKTPNDYIPGSGAPMPGPSEPDPIR